MPEIIPAILEPDFAEVARKLNLLEGKATWAHLDITDGHFVPSVSWQNPGDLETMNGKIKLEAHLMIEHPEEVVAQWLEVVDRIIIHYESTDHLAEIIETIDQSPLPVEVGLAFLLPTPLQATERVVAKLDVVQLMGIARVGYQGQDFDPVVLERIRFLQERCPDVKISIDGGVNLANAAQLVAAGADNLIVGSAFWKNQSVAQTILDFQHAIGRQS